MSTELPEKWNKLWRISAKNELLIMIKESKDDILRKSLYKVQTGIRSVMYQAVQHVMVALLRKEFTRDTLEAHIARLFWYWCSNWHGVEKVVDLKHIHSLHCNICDTQNVYRHET